MRTKTQMAFFQHKKPITIRRNQEKIKKSNNKNSTLNLYKITSKFLNASDLMPHSLGKITFAKKENSISNSESMPQLFKSQEKRFTNKNIDNKKKLLLSNVNYFQRNINNNNIKNNSNHKSENSLLVENIQHRYYLKINNKHNDVQNSYSLPKIKIMKNPMQISLDKEEKKFKEKKAISQRNNINFNNNAKSKIIYKLKDNPFFQNKYPEEISFSEILKENFPYYQQAKHSENSFDKIISYGVNTYRGVIRNYNEDRVTILINALINKDNHNAKQYLKNLKISFFSIYDGHAGNKCCEFLKKFLHHYIFESEFFPSNPIKAIEDGFNVCENKFMNLIYSDNKFIDPSGSCALVLLILNDICYIANLGDSRALYSCNDGKKFFQVSRDHKPNDPIEKNRIYKAGGSIYKPSNNSPQKNAVNSNEKLERMVKIPYRINPGRLAVSYFYHYLGF